jgi:hypothetical protein
VRVVWADGGASFFLSGFAREALTGWSSVYYHVPDGMFHISRFHGQDTGVLKLTQ